MELLKQWLKKPNQKVQYEKLTDKDKVEFQKYLKLLIDRTVFPPHLDVIFQSADNDKVNKVTIKPNF